MKYAPSLGTHVPCIRAEDLPHLADAVVVDLRSPSEFAQDHVPGAVNVPLFDDAERALIGTLYRRVSARAAFEAGRERAWRRIRGLVEAVAAAAGWEPPAEELEQRVLEMTLGGIEGLERSLEPVRAAAAGERPVVLHCWRGGLRSRSVVAFLRGLGLERACGLEGGYKGYRRSVVEGLERLEAPPTFVLRGLTGTGKTLVLHELERQRPGWTMDLEGMAGHRGSILGMVGLEQASQKRFESRLLARLRRGFGPALVVEGESRRIGNVTLPPRAWSLIDEGTTIELGAPMDRRVDVLMEEYLGREGNRAELREQLPFIEKRLGPVQWKGRLVGLLDQGLERELVEILLEQYYDPLYLHGETPRRPALRADSTDPELAAARIAAWIAEEGLARAASGRAERVPLREGV